MRKKYDIYADCAACALKMEDAASKIDGVEEASVNVITQKLFVKFKDGADEKEVMQKVAQACRKVEPDCDLEF